MFIDIITFYAIPLLFASLGGLISEKSGIINISLEGQMFLGAFVASTVCYFTNSWTLAFLFAGLFCGISGLLHAIISIKYSGSQVVSGTALNFLLPGIALFLSQLIFDSFLTPSISSKPPEILGINILVFVAIGCTFFLWFFYNHTGLGLNVKACGENHEVAINNGINVNKIRYISCIISGAFAGVAGAYLSIVVLSFFTPTLIAGKGFIALAAVIFGRWHPLYVAGTCILFGSFQALSVILLGESVLPAPIFSMMPFVLSLIVFVIFSSNILSPKSLGKNYKRI